MKNIQYFASFSGWMLVPGVLALCVAAYAQAPQESLRELVSEGAQSERWTSSTAGEKVTMFTEGLAASDAESRMYALGGIVLLAMQEPEYARSAFEPETVRQRFYDDDARVVESAFLAYYQLVDDHGVYERAVVQRAIEGGGPLDVVDYVRLLRGLSTDASRDWMISRAIGDPDQRARHSAMAALLMHLPDPPTSLLPEAVELIRSDAYFCSTNLVRNLPKFGSAAVEYLDELRELRQKLDEEIARPGDERSVTLYAAPEIYTSVMEDAIARLEQM